MGCGEDYEPLAFLGPFLGPVGLHSPADALALRGGHRLSKTPGSLWTDSPESSQSRGDCRDLLIDFGFLGRKFSKFFF